MSTDLPALLARVEAATGRDMELGIEVIVATLNAAGGAWNIVKVPPTWFVVNGEGVHYSHVDVTASLDAALALVERVRPGWSIRLHTYDDAKPCVYLGQRMGTFHEHDVQKGVGANPSLALLAALLRSMIDNPQGATP